VKEVWQVPESAFKKGYIQHTLGWPLQSKAIGADTFGGSFLYHMEPNVSTLRGCLRVPSKHLIF
jgi:electron-transferring-flavoprotein dehydrogenase